MPRRYKGTYFCAPEPPSEDVDLRRERLGPKTCSSIVARIRQSHAHLAPRTRSGMLLKWQVVPQTWLLNLLCDQTCALTRVLWSGVSASWKPSPVFFSAGRDASVTPSQELGAGRIHPTLGQAWKIVPRGSLCTSSQTQLTTKRAKDLCRSRWRPLAAIATGQHADDVLHPFTKYGLKDRP